MKATYLRLKNFVAIDATLHMKKIEIDFTKMLHSILLFIGTNGSCKTYILSQIHPFAYMGNVDIRHGLDMIIDGKDGEKEIHFANGDDKYIIRHFYMYRKSGRTIHSYIEKNGIELNTTGLVTSFNEIVKLEFGIDIGFLRVIRLGSNVNNLVSSKSTDRKDFAVKLLTEVDEYLHDYKEATQKSRSLNTELKLVVEKLKRFGDEEDAESRYTGELQMLEERLKRQHELKQNSVKEISLLQGKVESSIDGSITELRDKISSLSQSKKDLESKLFSLNSRFDATGITFIMEGSLDDLIDTFTEELHESEKELASVSAQIEVLSKSLIELKNDVSDLENQLQSMKEITDIDNIRKDLKSAEEFDSQYAKYYTSFKSTCTKDDVLDDIALMQTIKDSIDSLKEFSRKAREMYYKAYSKKKDPYAYCTNQLVKLRTELTFCNITKEHDEVQMTPPASCKDFDKCPFYKALEVKDFRSIQDIEKDIEIIQSALKICDGIHNIAVMLDRRKKSLPIKVSIENVILDLLNDTTSFYNFEEAEHMVTFLEKYDEWTRNKERIRQYTQDIRRYELQQESIDLSVSERRKSLIIRVSDGEKELNKLRKKKKKLTDEIEFGKEKIDEAIRFRDYTLERNSCQDKLNTLDEETSQLEDKIKLLKEFDEQKWSHEQFIRDCDNMITELESSIFSVKVKLKEYRELRERKLVLETEYGKTGLVRSAVSSTEGIPLLYLNLHFSRARTLANSIISSVYGDAIRLEKIVINEKEFRIPYSKNGVEVEDVIFASQGEVSVISLALSFALMEEFSGRGGYNILLLDEVDGPLDKGNKEKFLRVLESQMNRIGCEQVFMITHNQLFENYPVDVYVTYDKDNQLDSYKEINRIN